ncbi:hypothetical protein SKAU_G00122240 [Synaphobranchus kaupii]|uniref:Uncharacterized protein n=1 Tax=Synaphobranchus kaupii TaxID=118154 RepID=A0A9Q1J2I5_SYNKA|nr:hypothetical protein SKAU_G00122240 [Synaphobranchus kaupii]
MRLKSMISSWVLAELVIVLTPSDSLGHLYMAYQLDGPWTARQTTQTSLLCRRSGAVVARATAAQRGRGRGQQQEDIPSSTAPDRLKESHKEELFAQFYQQLGQEAPQAQQGFWHGYGYIRSRMGKRQRPRCTLLCPSPAGSGTPHQEKNCSVSAMR